MIYAWKGAWRPSIEPQPVGERLESLRRQHEVITADIVLEDATPECSVLHPIFEWNDERAAHEYRREQARWLIRHVVALPNDEEDRAPVRAFVLISDEDGGQAYTSTHIAMSDEILRKQVLTRALRELHQWEQRYQELQELAEIFATAERVRESIAL